jgi:hypothetical protein
MSKDPHPFRGSVLILHDVGAFLENCLGGGLCTEPQVGNILPNSWSIEASHRDKCSDVPYKYEGARDSPAIIGSEITMHWRRNACGGDV